MTEQTNPSELSYDAIREYAERIGRHHEIYDDSGLADIDRLVDRLGGTVEIADTSESMHVRRQGDFRIFLPTFTSARRDRFTKAHELGHYFLHYRHRQLAGAAAFQRGGRSLTETQANVFAASLLMPATEFTAAFEQCGADHLRLAQHFEVSPAAARVRCQVLMLG